MNKFTTLVVVFSFILVTNLLALEKITVSGTGDSQKLMRQLAKAFEKENPSTQIIVPNSIGSSGGVKSTALGKAELGRVARPLKESEKQYNLKYQLIAYSAMVFTVNQSVKNFVNITDQQVIDIYAGKLTQWEELDAKKGKIFVASREPGDSSYEIISKKISGFKNIKKMAGETIYSAPEMTDTIDMYQNTIGYMPLSQTINTHIKILNYNGVAPTKQNILDGTYPLVMPLGIVYKKLTPLSKRFLDFIVSSKGKKIIEEFGLVSSK